MKKKSLKDTFLAVKEKFASFENAIDDRIFAALNQLPLSSNQELLEVSKRLSNLEDRIEKLIKHV